MNKLLFCLAAVVLSFSADAGQHEDTASEVRNAVHAFNRAYADNEVDAYFSFYGPDAMVYFFGARQDLPAYHEEWADIIASGGAVEQNDVSDLVVQVMPGGDAAVASYFVDYRMRMPDGSVSEARAFESEVWQRIDGEWKIVSLHYTEIPDES